MLELYPTCGYDFVTDSDGDHLQSPQRTGERPSHGPGQHTIYQQFCGGNVWVASNHQIYLITT